MRTASVSAMSLLSAVALFGACDNPDPLSPAYVARSGAVAAPSNLVATPYSYEMITLAWQDNANNEAGFEVWRSTTGPTGAFTLFASYSSPNTTEGGNSGLQPLTQYCYEVRAYNMLGQSGKVRGYSGFSNVACATTKSLPVPAAASNVSAAPLSGGGAIHVGWTDNSADESGFRVERAASAAGPWTIVANLGVNATALFDYQYGVIEQQRCYRVFAVNSYGDSDPSNGDCTAIPATPTNLTANIANGAVDLTWTDNSSVEDGVEVQRAAAGEAWTVIATLPANATGYHDASLSPDVMYMYFVQAQRDGGTSGASNTVQALVVTAPPLAPVNVDALPYFSTAGIVTWVAGSSNQAGYRIEHSTDDGATWAVVGTAGRDETSFVDWPVLAEQRVCYRVVALNQIGESPASSVDCTTPPAGPTNLTATLLGDGTVELTWADNSNVEDGYQVWVDDGYGDVFVIASLDANVTSFIDASCYGCYYYAVVAIKDGGYSDFSDWVYPTSPAGVSGMRVRPPAPTSTPQPNLHLQDRKGLPR
jgi:hypothetical protein